ncbi:MAG: winged helix-turn-helix transcriptional regulator [Candidatus Bathyarchaeia archaeon]
MLLPCEIATRSVIPSIRRSLVKILYEEYGVKQARIAKTLGITQSAVNHYLREIRGVKIRLEEFEELRNDLESFAKELIDGGLKTPERIAQYCGLCNKIRKMGLMCKLHENYDPTVSIEECKICKDPSFCSKS